MQTYRFCTQTRLPHTQNEKRPSARTLQRVPSARTFQRPPLTYRVRIVVPCSKKVWLNDCVPHRFQRSGRNGHLVRRIGRGNLKG